MPSDHRIIIDFKHTLVRRAEQAYQRRDLDGLVNAIREITQFEHPQLALEEQRELDRLTIITVTMAAEAHLDDLDFETCFALCGQALDVLEESQRAFIRAGLPPRPSSLLWVRLIAVLADAKWKYLLDANDRCLTFAAMLDHYEQATIRVCEQTRGAELPPADVENRLHALLWCGAVLLKQARRFAPRKRERITKLMELVAPDALTNETWPYYWDQQIAEMLFSGQAARQSLLYLVRKKEDCLKHLYSGPAELSAYRFGTAKEIDYLIDHTLFARSAN